MATDYTARLNALAQALGVPKDNVVAILRAKQRALPTHDKEGTPLFNSVDSQTTDEGLVNEAYSNIDTIRKVTGR